MKLKPNGGDDMKPLPDVKSTPVNRKVDAVRAEVPSKLRGLKRGGTKGAKHKATKLREAFEGEVAKAAAGQAMTPLAAMLMVLADAVTDYGDSKAAWDIERKLPPPVDEDGEKARAKVLNRVRAASNKVVDVASQAAPYMHAKLASVENKGKLGVRVTVKGFGAKAEELKK